jgi:type II secretory pathway pseudopilin PulG
LITAVFVIVVLGLLGTSLMRIVSTEQAAVNGEIAAARALFAAESALQWGLYRNLAKGVSTEAAIFDGTPPPGLRGCDLQTKGLIGFEELAISPSASTASREIYRFESKGVCYEGRPEEARRQLEVRFWDWAE